MRKGNAANEKMNRMMRYHIRKDGKKLSSKMRRNLDKKILKKEIDQEFDDIYGNDDDRYFFSWYYPEFDAA